MIAENECAAGWTPAARISTGLAATERGFDSPPEATMATAGLDLAPANPRPVVVVQIASGNALKIAGQLALVLLALQSSGNRGLSAPDIQPACWHLASAIRDLRRLLGNEAIETLSGDRLHNRPARYRLVGSLGLTLETTNAEGQP